MERDGQTRVIVAEVFPRVDGGRYPVKRIVGERVEVFADVFADGHDEILAVLRYSDDDGQSWTERFMEPLGNDRWKASFAIEKLRPYRYTVVGWVDHFLSLQRALVKKLDAGQDVGGDLQVGREMIAQTALRVGGDDGTRLQELLKAMESVRSQSDMVRRMTDEELTRLMLLHADRHAEASFGQSLAVSVDPPKAGYSTWYELFPRSCDGGDHGTFGDCEKYLEDIARMGFDVLYLPPIHPIGTTNRKGRNNSPTAGPNDPGSPWAIGAVEGGHKAVNPALGTMADFEHLVVQARQHGMDVAIDIAFQCSPDHPYVREHPEWFRKRPDGTIQFAENPPKKYEDIVPFDFECDAWQALWDELTDVVLFWAQKGIRVFRVDNPHTKPLPFWEYLIARVRERFPETIFLAEAFTRPKVMQHLAKIGFSQSYTYFTWRNTKYELVEYLSELTSSPMKEYFRPNFWPNTPDILPEYVQFGGRPSFIIRLALAATLSANYGIYGPPFELYVHDALADKEEYRDSEKYQISQWDLNRPDSLRELITLINTVRRENPALQQTNNIRFHPVDNDFLLFFSKTTPDQSNLILVVVNLDPYHTQSGWVSVPLYEMGIAAGQPYLVHDLVSNDRFIWQGERNYIELNPGVMPVHIFRVHRRMRREYDFDYYF